MWATTIDAILGWMSILSQIAPREPDGLMSIDISTASSMVPPHPPIASAAVESKNAVGRVVDAEALVRALLCDHGPGDVAPALLEAGVDEHVDVWTPSLHTTTRHELMSALADIDDSIGDVAVAFTEVATTRSTALLAWQATGRFSRPAFLDDDRLLEPTGAVIRVAGATSVSFTAGGRADRIRCYYDRLALVEQVASRRPSTDRA